MFHVEQYAGTPPLAFHDSLVNSLTLYDNVTLLSLAGTICGGTAPDAPPHIHTYI